MFDADKQHLGSGDDLVLSAEPNDSDPPAPVVVLSQENDSESDMFFTLSDDSMHGAYTS